MTGAKLGQHFLVNKNVAEKIVRYFLPVDGGILEVGPGKGVLTELLLKYRQGNIIKAVELDTSLFYKLRSQFGDCEDFEVLNRNILKVGLDTLFREKKKIGLISNVPYYISFDFIDWVVSQVEYIAKGVLMLQKEFVDKLSSRPSSKEYNAQSVIFNYLFRMEKGFEVGPGSFSPHPRVKSTVFLFENVLDRVAPAHRVEVKGFYLFLQSCFRNRRKTLFNNLEKQYHPEKLWEVFDVFRMNPTIRAEQMVLVDFLDIYKRLSSRL